MLILDASTEAKPYTDENEIICWHWDHAKGWRVKGIPVSTTLDYAQEIILPVAFEIVSKTEKYIDKKTDQEQRRSKIAKHESARRRLQAVHKVKIPFKYVLTDIWLASAENMCLVKLEMQKGFSMALKPNRNAALSPEAKAQGKYQRIDPMEVPEGSPQTIYLEIPLHLVRQVFQNEDGSTGMRYLVTSVLTLNADPILMIYHNGGKWKSITVLSS